jgi:hypothetical protein
VARRPPGVPRRPPLLRRTLLEYREAQVVLHAGYHQGAGSSDAPHFSPDGLGRRVGARQVPLAELLNALLAAGLRLDRVEEFGSHLGQAHVPRDLALVASKPASAPRPP